jgi:alcohol dehydrogenase, propanol-preferring
MRAMVLERAREPLRLLELPEPEPLAGEVLIRVEACGVCRTDLHILDGELDEPKLPLVPGHQIAGTVAAIGDGVERFAAGDRVGVPWLAWACGECRFCLSGRENLCEYARFTGYDRDGGYAELATADARFALRLPATYTAVEAAPLLCAGLIGYRALRFCGDAGRIGLYGFGASAHLVCQVALYEGRRCFAFTRGGDEEGQSFAREIGCEWAGSSEELPPEPLDAAIVFAPVGALVPLALAATDRGGRVVCAGIHMSDIPAFAYELLWEERSVASVANLTRSDGEEMLALAPEVPVRAQIQSFSLENAGTALEDLRGGRVHGAAVLEVGGD